MIQKGQLKIYKYKDESKTIIVLGKTGSVKTPLLNSFENFILGLEFEDDFRYIIIDKKISTGIIIIIRSNKKRKCNSKYKNLLYKKIFIFYWQNYCENRD